MPAARLDESDDCNGKGKSKGAGVMLTLVNRVWPLAVLTLGLIMTVAWVGLLGYGLIMLL
jgi:hypothetical protein